MATQTYKIHCLSEALSPITHMSRTEGNEALINREEIHTPNGRRFMPFLTGNALRHRMVRDPGARFLLRRWELEGKLNMRALNFLFHGGTLTEGSGREDTAGVADLYRLFPLYRLLGGSLPGQIVPGSLIAEQGVVICRENLPRLRGCCPFDLPGNLRSAEEFVGGWQYTRSDVRISSPDLASRDAEGDKLQLMPFTGQSIIPGAMIWHGFIAQHAGELEMGALLLSIALWLDQGATIGGSSARGHGRLATSIHLEPEVDVTALMQAYIAHVDAVREEAIAWLNAAFEAKSAKKSKKGGKSDATPESNSSLG